MLIINDMYHISFFIHLFISVYILFTDLLKTALADIIKLAFTRREMTEAEEAGVFVKLQLLIV